TVVSTTALSPLPTVIVRQGVTPGIPIAAPVLPKPLFSVISGKAIEYKPSEVGSLNLEPQYRPRRPVSEIKVQVLPFVKSAGKVYPKLFADLAAISCSI